MWEDMVTYFTRLLTGGRRGFGVGLGMLLAGIGLTVVSSMAALDLGLGVTVIFYGLMIGGIVRMALSAPAMLGDEDRLARPDGRERSGRRPRPQAFIAPPSEMAPGLCWMCGGAVKSGSQICLHCGAAQAPEPPGESTTSRLSGYDPDASQHSSYIPSVSEPPRPTFQREPPRPTFQRELQRDSNRGQRPPPKAVWRPAADADEGWEQPYDDEADWDAPPARRPRRGRR